MALEPPTQAAIDQWHRWFAIECNNRFWDLASQGKRTPEEDQDMLNTIFASAYHWSKIGKPINNARADMSLAHAMSLTGRGDQAMFYAQRCVSWFENNDCEDWDLAFAHAELAFAAATRGEHELHAKHYAIAQQRGSALREEADRKIFLEELARLPAP